VGARQKLNAFSTIGAIGVAGIIRALTGSWLVFFVTAGALIGTALCAGDIRPDARRT
jgi:hypothetical protein